MGLPDVSLPWSISVTATLLLLTYFWFSRRNPRYPPCPLRPWPIVGNLLQLNPDPREQFVGFRKQCGDIYSLYMGPTHLVVLSGLEVVKEVFIKRGDDFSDRAITFLDHMTEGANRGIASSNGAVWKEHRLFSASVLRNIDVRGSTLAGIIQEEVNHFVALLESLNGEPKNLQLFTSISVSNSICSILVGQRYEYDNKEFQRLQEIMDFNFDKFSAAAILNYFPWLRFVPGDLFSYKLMKKRVSEFYDIFARVYVKKNEDVVGEPGNFVAAYFQAIKAKRLAGEKTYLEKAHLLKLILDLFGGGTEPVTTTIGWIFLYMVNYPDIQERLFQEIKDHVGVDRAPIMQDKSKLVFLEATIMEVQRIVALLPFSFPRVVSREVKLQEYVIPKDTTIIANFGLLLSDPLLWGEDANIFRPDRFINKDGRVTSPEAWVPFSLGRRSCLGESMARMQLFLFVSNVLQKFQILPAYPEALPPLKGKLGLTHRPLPFEVRMVCRTAR